jgi:hypothetical protein
VKHGIVEFHGTCKHRVIVGAICDNIEFDLVFGHVSVSVSVCVSVSVQVFTKKSSQQNTPLHVYRRIHECLDTHIKHTCTCIHVTRTRCLLSV